MLDQDDKIDRKKCFDLLDQLKREEKDEETTKTRELHHYESGQHGTQIKSPFSKQQHLMDTDKVF